MNKFNLEKLNDVTDEEKYEIKISNNFEALKIVVK
jgi:hypothetical protein